MLKARQGDNERSQGKPQERASLATTQSSGSNTHKHSIIVTKFEQPEEEVLIEGVECLTVSAKSENLEYAEDQDSEKGKEEGDQSEEDEPSDASGCSDDEDVIEAEEQEGDVDVYSDEKDTEPKQLTADVNDVDEFPSLGGETSVSAAQQVDAAKPAFSWAKIAKDPPTAPKHPVVLPKTNIVIPAGKPTQQRSLLDEYSQGVARTEPADREPSGSRILRSTGASEYTSAASNALRAEEDDGSNWISPSNVKACRVTGAGMLGGPQALGVKSNKVIENTKVACVTTDFSMENVILQMGLHLMSVEGRLIHRIKQWVLRCAACYTIHYETDRLFCSRCGVNMLQRIAASTDARTGELHLHLKKNYTPNTRGLIHSLPKPGSQGRYDGELLLREDQLLTGIWRQKVSKIKHDVKSAFGEDVTKDVGMSINKREFGIKVGLGRRNPNADKGRERRGKKKTKK
jgi:rRNA maturation endonuclease Nob1